MKDEHVADVVLEKLNKAMSWDDGCNSLKELVYNAK